MSFLLEEKPTRSLSEFEFIHDPRDQQSRLGIGSFAVVKLAREKNSQKLMAIKMADFGNSKSKAADLNNISAEVRIHSRIDHPNIIKYCGYAQENSCIYIVLEYAEKGNLYKYLHDKKPLKPQEISRFFVQTCLAVQYLHQQDIVHRDIKPENLLLDKDLNIKICDFGWAAENIRLKRIKFCGTYEYMAPEVVYRRPYDYRIDIWSLGILLYELIHKEAPFKGHSLAEMLTSLSKKSITFSPSIDPQAKDLIQKILKVNPTERATLSDILCHPWVRNYMETNEVSFPVPNKIEKLTKKEKVEPELNQMNNMIPKKPSDLKSPDLDQASRIRRVKEHGAESKKKARNKSSLSLTKIIIESLNTEDNKKFSIDLGKDLAKKKRKLSSNLKKSLKCIVSRNKSTVPTSNLFGEALTNSSSATVSKHLNINGSSIHPTTPQTATHGLGLTLFHDSSNAQGITDSTPIISSQTPLGRKKFHALAPAKNILTPSYAPTKPRLLFGSNAVELDSTFHTTRRTGHQKTLTVGEISSSSRRILTEQTDTPSNRIFYKDGKCLLNSDCYDVPISNINLAKELPKNVASITSPLNGTKSIIPTIRKESTKLEECYKDQLVLKPIKDFNNVIKARPEHEHAAQTKINQKEGFGIDFSKFNKENIHSKPRAILRRDSEGVRLKILTTASRARGHNKENKSEGENKIKGLIENMYTPSDQYFHLNNK